jgi:hypothetical protein
MTGPMEHQAGYHPAPSVTLACHERLVMLKSSIKPYAVPFRCSM